MFRSIVGLGVLLLSGSPLAAQRFDFAQGQRIRVTAPAEGVFSPSAGTVMQVLPDSIVVDLRGVQHTLSRRGITRLQVSRGKVSRAEGLFNVGLGVAGGYAVGWLHHEMAAEGRDGSVRPEDRRDRRPLFALAGGAAGMLFAAFRPDDRWETVRVNAFAVPGPATGGAGVAVTLRF